MSEMTRFCQAQSAPRKSRQFHVIVQMPQYVQISPLTAGITQTRKSGFWDKLVLRGFVYKTKILRLKPVTTRLAVKSGHKDFVREHSPRYVR